MLPHIGLGFNQWSSLWLLLLPGISGELLFESSTAGPSRLLGRSLVAAFGASSAGWSLGLRLIGGLSGETGLAPLGPLEAPPLSNASTICWRCSGRFSPYSTTGFPFPFSPVPFPLALPSLLRWNTSVLLQRRLGFSAASHSSAFLRLFLCRFFLSPLDLLCWFLYHWVAIRELTLSGCLWVWTPFWHQALKLFPRSPFWGLFFFGRSSDSFCPLRSLWLLR